MKTEQMIMGLACIRATVEVHKETMPVQTENQLKCIDEVISRLKSINGLSACINAINRDDMDVQTLVGFNMAVALFNKYLGEER